MEIGVLVLRSHIKQNGGLEHYNQWSRGQKTRRVNAALITITALCQDVVFSIKYKRESKREFEAGFLYLPLTLLLWSFPHNDICIWVILGHNQQSRAEQETAPTAAAQLDSVLFH